MGDGLALVLCVGGFDLQSGYLRKRKAAEGRTQSKTWRILSGSFCSARFTLRTAGTPPLPRAYAEGRQTLRGLRTTRSPRGEIVVSALIPRISAHFRALFLTN